MLGEGTPPLYMYNLYPLPTVTLIYCSRPFMLAAFPVQRSSRLSLWSSMTPAPLGGADQSPRAAPPVCNGLAVSDWLLHGGFNWIEV